MIAFNNEQSLQPVELVGSNGAAGFNSAHVGNDGSIATADAKVAALLAASTAGGQGNKAVVAAGTPVALAAATPCTMVIITARVGNTKQIAYGWSNAVRATAGAEIGAQLQPGDSVSLKVADLSQVWLDAQVNNEGVSFTYMTN